MNLEIFSRLNNATLTKEDFVSLPYFKQNDYIESAKARFSKLDTHLDPSHVDWQDRISANRELSFLLEDYLKKNNHFFIEKKVINLIELGASLGAITTLLSLKILADQNLLEKTQIWLLDIHAEGLEKTKKLEFNLPLLLKKCGIDQQHFKLIERKISEAKIVAADITRLPQKLPKFEIILSGFTHHHLNLAGKKKACLEMEKIAAPNAFLGIGDLFFEYENFIMWLKKHKKEKNSKGERVPYAMESFIPVNQHIGFFTKSHLQAKQQRQNFYAFYLIKK